WWFCNTDGSAIPVALAAKRSYVSAISTTIVGGEKHRARLDLWVDGGIKSPAVLRPASRRLTFKNGCEFCY
ncbi:hypothetical protein U1Q18_047872, partial [Sarracenia purpurea var. burkii]